MNPKLLERWGKGMCEVGTAHLWWQFNIQHGEQKWLMAAGRRELTVRLILRHQEACVNIEAAEDSC